MTSNRKTKGAKHGANSGKISREALEKKGGTIPMGHKHWLRKALLALNKDELYFIAKADWNWKGRGNTPARIVTSLNNQKVGKYSIALAADDSGWVIERME